VTIILLLLACSSGDSDTDTSEVEASFLDDCPVDAPATSTLELGGVDLHVVCRGTGPTLVFLHGCPEFWYAWTPVMDELADEYRLIALDQRGYNLSEKPEDVADYTIDLLAADIGALLDYIGEPVVLVIHDWGGPVGWVVTHQRPEMIRGLVGMNAPHPNVLFDLLLTDPEQQQASSYVDFFISDAAEGLLMANDFAGLVASFEGALSDDEIEVYKEAWGQEDALTGGLNWYRANTWTDESWTTLWGSDLQVTIDVPTRVLWGLDDSALLPQNLDGLDQFVPDLEIVEFPGVDHWIEHRIPADVAAEIRDFEGDLP
jgi:epoxide hydrolase 4